MKRIFFILLIFSALYICNTNAQIRLSSTYTPNSTYVPGYLWSYELTTTEYNNAQYYVTSNFPSASIKRVSTRAYNCHGYAWHMSNHLHGWTQMIWINDPDQRKYMPSSDGGDNSYAASSEAIGRKVWYSQGDHSAVVISGSPGSYTYRSKWGQCALVTHAKTYCPYVTTGLKYYYNSSYLGDKVSCSIDNVISKLNWELTLSDENIDGFNVIKMDENQNRQTINDKLIPRKSYEDINQAGESYSFPLMAADQPGDYYLEIIRKDGEKELIKFSGTLKN